MESNKQLVEHNMSHSQFNIKTAVESEVWSMYTPSVASDNTTKELDKGDNNQSSTPWPGRVFIIRSRANGKVITFLNGKIILEAPGGLGTFRWRCTQNKGWMGFQDPASAMYLGCSQSEWLECVVPHHRDCEYILPQKRPDGGYVILMLKGGELRPLATESKEDKMEEVEQKVKLAKWESEEIAWDFIEV